MSAVPFSLLPASSTVAADGWLEIGGVHTRALVEQFGTPVFVYDEAQLRARCREAVEAFGPGVAYASKAFLCGAMARLAAEEGMHIDVASGGEMFVAMRAGVGAERLVLHGNNSPRTSSGTRWSPAFIASWWTALMSLTASSGS